MALQTSAEALLEKVRQYETGSQWDTPGAKAQLRESIRRSANGIIAQLEGPDQTMHNLARAYSLSAAFKVCKDLAVADRLPTGQSRSIDDLAKECQNCDPRVLRPVLRVLSQYGVFEQDEEGKWCHNELSCVFLNPAYRAWFNSIMGEKFPSINHLPEFLKETKYVRPSTGKAAYNQIFDTNADFYTKAADDDHIAAANFAESMKELGRVQSPFTWEAYPFHKLHPRSHFVDVAGGIGNFSWYLAERLTKAKFTIQDLDVVIQQAEESCPAELESRFSFEKHDMYDSQDFNKTCPDVELDRVIILKIILHDHDDQQCRKVLKNILSCMRPQDRLLLVETVLPEVGGYLSSTLSDMIILSMFGCGHRTLKEWYALIESCGHGVAINHYAGKEDFEFDGMMVIEVRTSTGQI